MQVRFDVSEARADTLNETHIASPLQKNERANYHQPVRTRQSKLDLALNENLKPLKVGKGSSKLSNHNVQLGQPRGHPHQSCRRLQLCDPQPLKQIGLAQYFPAPMAALTAAASQKKGLHGIQLSKHIVAFNKGRLLSRSNNFWSLLI
jgi:hypothetical protein